MDATLSQLLERLQANHCPEAEEIQMVLAHPEQASALLLPLLNEASQWNRVPETASDAYLHALFLLAALEQPAALEPLTRMLRRDFDFIENVFGDILFECLPWALARLGRNQPEPLIALLRNPATDLWARDTVLRGYCARALLWPETRAEVVQTCRQLLADAALDDDEWPWRLSEVCPELQLPELDEPLQQLCEQFGFVPPTDSLAGLDRTDDEQTAPMREQLDVVALYGQCRQLLAWNDPQVAAERERTLAQYPEPAVEPLFDAEQEKIVAENPEPIYDPVAPLPPPHQSLYKIGRNDPCPCGSARKFKKCCLEAAPEIVLARLLPQLGARLSLEQLRAEVLAACRQHPPAPPADVLKGLFGITGEGAFPASKTQLSLFMQRFTAFWKDIANPTQQQAG